MILWYFHDTTNQGRSAACTFNFNRSMTSKSVLSSVTKLGKFLKGLATNYLTSLAQKFGNFLGSF